MTNIFTEWIYIYINGMSNPIIISIRALQNVVMCLQSYWQEIPLAAEKGEGVNESTRMHVLDLNLIDG